MASGSESGFFNQSPVSRPCAVKTMSNLLYLADRRRDRGNRPCSLKVTTISVLTGGVVEGNSNFLHLAARGNYRAATYHGVGKVYSRVMARRRIYVSKFAHPFPGGDKNIDAFRREIPEERKWGGGSALKTEAVWWRCGVGGGGGGGGGNWSVSFLRNREQPDVLKSAMLLYENPREAESHRVSKRP